MIKLARITFDGFAALTAAFEAWASAIDWSCNVTAVAPVTLQRTPTGPVIGYMPGLTKKVKLTSAGATSGSYNASEVYAASSGAWTVYPSGWTGVVWEYNLFATITTPAYATVEWCGPTSDWRFQLGGC